MRGTCCRTPAGDTPQRGTRPSRKALQDQECPPESENMTGFWKPEEMASRELCPGVTAKVAWGEKLMFSLVTLAPDAVVPEHAHPHEQMGMLVSGTMTLV